MALSYYGVRLSDNIVENPKDGTLVCLGAVIARTGFQKYRVKEIPETELKPLGVELQPDDEVSLYRSPEEVFSPTTIASFEGKPLTDDHPNQLLTIETIRDHARGHIQNVRRGSDPLPDGNFPLLADIFVTDKALIDKIKAGLRELSCGYNYHVAKDGNQLCQIAILGNHVAVVENGRAGAHAKIMDSVPKERITTMSKLLDKVRQLGTRALLANSTPEELRELVAVALDAAPADEHPKDCTCKDCKGAMDAKAKDAKARDKYHAALDRYMDGIESEEMAADAEVDELKSMFGERTAATDSKEDNKEDGEGKDADIVLPLDVIPEADRPKPDEPGAVDTAALDAAFAEGFQRGQRKALNVLRPSVAKLTKGSAVRGAFDSAMKLANAPANVTKSGGYKTFAAASATLSTSARDSVATGERESSTKLAKATEDAYKGMHRIQKG